MLSSSSYSRRLLQLHHPTSNLASLPTAAVDGVGHNSSQPTLGAGHFDANFIMVLSITVCATVCALGLHFALRRSVYWCSRREPESTDGGGATATMTIHEPSAAVASTGVDKEALQAFPKLTYSTSLKLPECTICLSDFVGGDQVRVLPKCSHGFHLKCIDKWLKSHTSCPNCRHCLVSTDEKSEPVLVPLPPEALMPNLQSSC
ncbi:hypothetical protein ACLOJK_041461 [Asimina triloba]